MNLRGFFLRGDKTQIAPPWEQELEQRAQAEDARSNAQLALPSSEHVAWPGFWLGEVYGPSTVTSLMQGMRAFGFDRGEEYRHNGWDAASWVAASRAGSSSGYARFCPWLVPEDGEETFSTQPAELPAGIASVQFALVKVGPSTTVCVAVFAPSATTQRALKDELSRPARREDRSSGYGIVSMHGVHDVRRERLRDLRGVTHAAAAEWMQAHIPGVFASLGNMPSVGADLLVTEELQPLAPVGPPFDAPHWPILLGLDGIESGYEADRLRGLRLRPPDVAGGERILHVVGGRRRELETLPLYREPLPEMDSVLPRVQQPLALLTARLSLNAALHGLDAQLASVRDTAERSASTGKKAVARLEELRHRLLPLADDGALIAEDARQLADKPDRFDLGVPAFTVALDHPRYDLMSTVPNTRPEVRGSGDLRPPTLNEALRSWVTANSDGVTRRAKHVRDSLQLDADLLQAAANLKIQRWVSYAAGFALIVSTLSLIAALDDKGPSAPATVTTKTLTVVTVAPPSSPRRSATEPASGSRPGEATTRTQERRPRTRTARSSGP